MRHAEVYKAGSWVPTEFDQLKSGDTFKLFEEDGTEVHNGVVLNAVSDPYPDKDGILTIDTLRE